MKAYIIILQFFVIALMRVVQKICNKISSNEISCKRSFFAYGAFYQFFAAAFAIISVFFVGFHNFNLELAICSVLTAALFAIDLFSGLVAIKGCSIAVATMFGLGGLIISVLISYFWFGEDIEIHQLAGLVVFFVSAYLLSSRDNKSGKKLSLRTFVMLFINFVANGLVMVVQKYFALRVEGGNTLLFSFVSFALCGVFMLFCYIILTIKHKERDKLQENTEKDEPILNKKLVICGMLLAFALFLINVIITEMGKTVSAIIIFPVSSAISIIIATMVGYIVFKEKLSLKKIIGLVIGIVSIIVIGI